MSSKSHLVIAINKESLDLRMSAYRRLLDEFDLMSFSIVDMWDLPEEKLQRLLDEIREEAKK